MVCNLFEDIKAVVFDLDGTIYFGSKTLAPKANEVIELARKKYKNVFFATNNSAITQQALYERLKKLNINLNVDEVINSTFLIAKYLKQNEYKQIFCLGTDMLAEEIKQEGIDPKSQNPEAIVIGYDKDFNMDKLEEAINVYHSNCKLIIANKEKTYPRDKKIMAPGAGAAVAAFEYCVNKFDEIIIGKPHTEMLAYISKKLNINSKNILMIGDTIESDVKMANDFGSKCVYIQNDKPKYHGCCSINKLEELLEMM